MADLTILQVQMWRQSANSQAPINIAPTAQCFVRVSHHGMYN